MLYDRLGRPGVLARKEYRSERARAFCSFLHWRPRTDAGTTMKLNVTFPHHSLAKHFGSTYNSMWKPWEIFYLYILVSFKKGHKTTRMLYAVRNLHLIAALVSLTVQNLAVVNQVESKVISKLSIALTKRSHSLTYQSIGTPDGLIPFLLDQWKDANMISRIVHCHGFTGKAGEGWAGTAVREMSPWRWRARQARTPRGETGEYLELAIKYWITGNETVGFHMGENREVCEGIGKKEKMKGKIKR